MSNKTGNKFIKLNDVKEMTTLSKSTIYAKMKDDLFPKNLILSRMRCAVWIKDEIDNWMNEQIEACRGIEAPEC